MKKTNADNQKKKSDESPSPESLNDFERKEFFGEESKKLSLELSDTDEDEDEGIGDGTIHRRDDDPFSK